MGNVVVVQTENGEEAKRDDPQIFDSVQVVERIIAGRHISPHGA